MKLKKLISNTIKYWYIYILSFCFLETINYGVLNVFVPEKICFWISAFLIFLLLGYLCVTISVVYDELCSIFKEKEKELNQTIDDLKNHINRMDNENKELASELARSISDDISSGNDNVIRTIETDLSCSKDFIASEVHDIGNELKEIIHIDSNKLIDKTNDIIGNQDKCTEKIIKNENSVANESAELLKEKTTAIIEQNSSLINTFSTELREENRENAESLISEYNKVSKETRNVIEQNHSDNADKQSQQYKNIIDAVKKAEDKIASEIEENIKTLKNVDAKIEEKIKLADENINAKSIEILQILDNNRNDSKQDIKSVKDELAKGTDDILEIGNTIINKQQQITEENQRAFVNICEGQKKQAGDIKDTICESIKEASEREVKEISECKEKIVTQILESAKSQSSNTEELNIRLIKKISELVQSSNGELTKHVAENIKELNTSYLETKKTYETNNKKVEEKLIGLHSETIKLINLLLDSVEDNSEKNGRYINILGSQISGVAKQNKNSINSLLNELEKNKEQVSQVIEKLSEYASEQKKNSGDSERRTQEYIKALSDYYSKCFDKIDNIQSEILSISHTTNLLNNLYSKLQSSIKENSGKEPQNTKDKSERIEEYKDTESGAIVKNHYKNNRIAYSEMIVAGRKSYDVQYDSEGKTLKSHNYNKQGKVISEIDFYKNGQVKTRKEILVKNGKEETIISEFDEKGNRIK